MKISYNWLRQFIHLDESPEEVAALLTSVGLEVEGIEQFESINGGMKMLVVGEVKEKWQHPNADRLSCTKVDVGTGELLPIVCGASNVAVGQKVIVALVGAVMHPFSGDSFEIKAAKIRGEESRGMICAEDEIGIGQSHDGILVLPAETPIGKAASELFEVETDHVFEIGLTPNRADAASHLGVARDLKAVLSYRKGKQLELNKPVVQAFEPKSNLNISVKVLNTEACPRYVGITISGLKVQASPSWLQNRLKSIGVRPINNVVDVTNFVNHAFGQPLHAFDAAKIQGNQVIVKTVDAGTKFTALDGVTYNLDQDDLMICNESKPMCIAGVFGGADSGVNDNTTAVFLESAYFNPVCVRKTAKRHALHTDASFRFERGIDPNITAYAAHVAAQMIAEIAGGNISSSLSDTHPETFPGFEVAYRLQKVNQFIGHTIAEQDTAAILEGLDIQIASKSSTSWKLQVPAFKVDVTREVDVAEEVLRIYGYDNVPMPTKMLSTVKDMKQEVAVVAKEAITNLLVANGFYECMTNSMIDQRMADLGTDWTAKEVVHLSNPLSSEMGIMRPALIFSALTNAAHNLNRQQNDLKLFEFGNIYRSQAEGFFEEERLGILVTGQQIAGSWRIADIPADWYFLKSVLEMSLKRLAVDINKFTAVETENEWFDYGMDWKSGDRVIITAGHVSQALRKSAEIKKDIWYLELSWRPLVALRNERISMGELPKFPEVTRDLALLVDQGIRYADFERLAYQGERKLLRSVSLFDVYEGKGLPAGKKSYALRFSLRDDEKTLTDQEVEKVMSKLLERFKREVGAELRG